MNVREAKALYCRVSDDLGPATEEVTKALALLRNGLIGPHVLSEQNKVYAGKSAGNVAFSVEQALDEAVRKVGVLKRSLEVAGQAIGEARKEAQG